MPPIRHNQMNSSPSHILQRIHMSLWGYQPVTAPILKTMLELTYYCCFYCHAVIGVGALQIH